MQRRKLLKAAGAAWAAVSVHGLAQSAAGNWPALPVKLIIAFPPGGPTDITMRVLAENASKLLGQPGLIENKPGAGGTLPALQLQQSKPDGYTLAQIPLGVFRLPHAQKINWDPVKDITHITHITHIIGITGITGCAFGLVVPADSAIKSWADLVA